VYEDEVDEEADEEDDEVDDEDDDEPYDSDANHDSQQYYLETKNPNTESLNESIMNWSMKISNYASDTNKQRSQSRSPYASPPDTISRHLDTLQASLDNTHHVQQKRRQQKRQAQAAKEGAAVTSWGQLKHSKSSSSQLGSPLEQSRVDYGTQTMSPTAPMSPPVGEATPVAHKQPQPLYKLFQTSKTSMTSGNSNETARSSRRDCKDVDEQIAPQLTNLVI
jgi:hypothetical protein